MTRAGENPSVGHYDVLGVPPTASFGEIRGAYLALAREYHPDRLGHLDAAAQDGAASRMARINAAWSVLGDPARRSAYDAASETATGGHRQGSTVRDAPNDFQPFDRGDDWVDPRLIDDTPSGTRSLGRGLTFLPVLLGVGGAALLFFGMLLGFGALVNGGVFLFVLSGVSFLLIPLVAMIRSSRADGF